jgi:hypothetical protein
VPLLVAKKRSVGLSRPTHTGLLVAEPPGLIASENLSYSAMTTDRSYRRAMSGERVIAELRACAGAQFDPAVVDALVGLLEDPAQPDEASAVGLPPSEWTLPSTLDRSAVE